MATKLLLLHTLSPLHAGTGQGTGVIDLPIAREKATGLPYLPGSSVKGTLRDASTPKEEDTRDAKELHKAIFGPPTTNADEHAGGVQFSDQRLLCMPVRSLAGTFAWVTSPYLLRRFAREASDIGLSGVPVIPSVNNAESCAVLQADTLVSALPIGNQVYLEDLNMNAYPTSNVMEWANFIAPSLFGEGSEWVPLFAQRLCVVHDDVMNFLLTTATEVIARIKLLEDKKTVQKGGLWYEEALPTETILYGLVVATQRNGYTPRQIMAEVETIIESKSSFQFGGKATVGRGVCHVRLMG